MKIMQPLTEALATSAGISWARSEATQLFLQTLKDLVATAQDAWLEGHFQSSRELEIAEHASANTLFQIVTAIQDVKLPEKENVDGKQVGDNPYR